MKPAKEIRVGNIIMVDSKPMIVLRSDVNGSSRTGFTYKWKMKNLLTDTPMENVFRGDDKFDDHEQAAPRVGIHQYTHTPLAP